MHCALLYCRDLLLDADINSNVACTDIHLADGNAWHDSESADHACDWYSADVGLCTQRGQEYMNMNKSATVVCCSCGGGQNVTWNQYNGPLVLDQPSVYRLSARSAHAEMMKSATETIELKLQWPSIPDLTANVLPDGEEVSLHFWTPGTENTSVSYQITQLSEEWTDVVVIGAYGQSVLLNNATHFNQMFSRCPVVQYVRNGAVVAVYTRTSSIPASFDAHHLFTYTWVNEDNMLGQNFELYDTLDDAILDSGAWEFCNYNNPDVGFPRDCGKYKMEENRWFTMPSGEPQYTDWRFNPRGVGPDGLKFQIFSGSKCPVHASLLSNSTAEHAFTYAKCVGTCLSLHVMLSSQFGVLQRGQHLHLT